VAASHRHLSASELLHDALVSEAACMELSEAQFIRCALLSSQHFERSLSSMNPDKPSVKDQFDTKPLDQAVKVARAQFERPARTDALHAPFRILHTIAGSVRVGSFLSPTLFLRPELWAQAGSRLPGMALKKEALTLLAAASTRFQTVLTMDSSASPTQFQRELLAFLTVLVSVQQIMQPLAHTGRKPKAPSAPAAAVIPNSTAASGVSTVVSEASGVDEAAQSVARGSVVDEDEAFGDGDGEAALGDAGSLASGERDASGSPSEAEGEEGIDDDGVIVSDNVSREDTTASDALGEGGISNPLADSSPAPIPLQTSAAPSALSTAHRPGRSSAPAVTSVSGSTTLDVAATTALGAAKSIGSALSAAGRWISKAPPSGAGDAAGGGTKAANLDGVRQAGPGDTVTAHPNHPHAPARDAVASASSASSEVVAGAASATAAAASSSSVFLRRAIKGITKRVSRTAASAALALNLVPTAAVSLTQDELAAYGKLILEVSVGAAAVSSWIRWAQQGEALRKLRVRQATANSGHYHKQQPGEALDPVLTGSTAAWLEYCASLWGQKLVHQAVTAIVAFYWASVTQPVLADVQLLVLRYVHKQSDLLRKAEG
jgi:hypothetical protein